MIRLIFLLIFLFSFSNLYSQKIWQGYEHLMHPAQNYVVYKTISEININGKPDEISWQKAKWSEVFCDIEGDLKPEPLYQTRFKMLWDTTNLYILAELEEPHVWAYYDKHDMIVFHENDFEVFIDPDRSTHNYFEFEVNAQNTLFDLFLPKPYRNGGPAIIKWNAEGFKSAVFVDGTLNDPSDIDKMWAIEMAIPFSSLTYDSGFAQPEEGSTWKIGFSRVQWQTEIADGKYVKKKNKITNRNLSEDNWVWSPQGIINMHYPERWGMIQFARSHVDSEKQVFVLPLEEKLNDYLWLIYYKQRQFLGEFGVFSGSLEKLEIPGNGKVGDILFQLELNTDVRKFNAVLNAENGMKLSINESGLFQILNQ